MSAVLVLLSVALVAAQTRLPPKLSPTFGNPTLPIKPVADPLPVSPSFGGSGDTRTLLPPTSLPQSFGFVTRLNVSVSPDVSSQVRPRLALEFSVVFSFFFWIFRFDCC